MSATRRGASPPARLRALGRVLHEHPIQRVIEANTLQADARDLERTSRVELSRLVHVLRRGVLPAGQGLLDQTVGGLVVRILCD